MVTTISTSETNVSTTPKGKQALADRLKARFPHEAEGIDGYIDMVGKLVDSLHDLGQVKNPLDAVQAAPDAGSILRWALRSGQQLVDHFVTDPVLKAILMAQAGDHGVPPSQVSALMQASITQHYFNGAYYPLGGAEAIPNAFVKALQTRRG